ncbi:hypothetical protein ABZP36_007910 [Zizania latifolia]
MPTVVAMAVLVLLLLIMALTPPAEMAPLAAATVAGDGRQPPAPFVKFRARLPRRQPFFSGRAANGCMPRGFRVPPSAPSRYVNYHTLDAGLCDHSGRQKP